MPKTNYLYISIKRSRLLKIFTLFAFGFQTVGHLDFRQRTISELVWISAYHCKRSIVSLDSSMLFKQGKSVRTFTVYLNLRSSTVVIFSTTEVQHWESYGWQKNWVKKLTAWVRTLNCLWHVSKLSLGKLGCKYSFLASSKLGVLFLKMNQNNSKEVIRIIK